MTEKKTNKRILSGTLVLAAVILIFAGVYVCFREKPVAGKKNVVIEVIGSSQNTITYPLQTEVLYLRQAMEEAGILFSGIESEYGLMVHTVNGERADYAEDNAYWSFYVNGEYCNYGIDTQPVEDGDRFQIVYTLNVAR